MHAYEMSYKGQLYSIHTVAAYIFVHSCHTYPQSFRITQYVSIRNTTLSVSILNFHHRLNYVGKIKIFLNWGLLCYNQSWQYNDFINMIRKQRILLDAKMKNALVKCSEEIKRLAPFFSFILKS
jgi:hypothetical protein